jgi:hypothetical protein
MLTQKELQLIYVCIDKLDSGTYEIKEILGEHWSLIKSPTSFGKRFKKFIRNGGINEITFVNIKTNNHNIYKLKR